VKAVGAGTDQPPPAEALAASHLLPHLLAGVTHASDHIATIERLVGLALFVTSGAGHGPSFSIGAVTERAIILFVRTVPHGTTVAGEASPACARWRTSRHVITVITLLFIMRTSRFPILLHLLPHLREVEA
jgi:hypothetical protein